MPATTALLLPHFCCSPGILLHCLGFFLPPLPRPSTYFSFSSSSQVLRQRSSSFSDRGFWKGRREKGGIKKVMAEGQTVGGRTTAKKGRGSVGLSSRRLGRKEGRVSVGKKEEGGKGKKGDAFDERRVVQTEETTRFFLGHRCWTRYATLCAFSSAHTRGTGQWP